MMIDFRVERIALSTGVELAVARAGSTKAPPVIFLHGFPESARTWRYQLEGLGNDFQVIAPDQRGFAKSSKPPEVADYAVEKTVADIFALADAMGFERFSLVGHDWGGAIAWVAALGNPARVERLAIVNAPHPYIFQKSLFDDPEQRAASQYITKFRIPGIEHYISVDLPGFFEKTFGHSGMGLAVSPEDRAAYIEEWSQPGAIAAMLNWYRAAGVVVPAVGEEAERPAYLDLPFPKVRVPTLVIWGMQDKALLPLQLEGLDDLVDNVTVVQVPDAGHFVTWEKAEPVTNALREFLSRV